MAVLVEGISVVIRTDRLLQGFQDDWAAFRDIVPNDTLCADGELVRVGFMHPDDVRSFVVELQHRGLQHLVDGHAIDCVVADQLSGLTSPCDWVEYGKIDWAGDPNKKVSACRLKGSTSKQIVTPDGWDYDRSLSSSFCFVSSEAETGMRLEEDDGKGLQTWRSPLSEKPQYLGRPYRKQPSEDASPPKKMGWLSRLWGRT